VEINKDIRDYLDILEYYSSEFSPIPEVHVEPEEPMIDCTQRLSDIIFKLRSYTDTTGGDYSLGFEQGLEMAAQMIDNLINAMGENSGS
jgi:hypothetical protein